MDTRSAHEPQWLTRPGDIAVHLACASADKRPVTLTAFGVTAQGFFPPPDPAGPVFAPDSRVLLPNPGPGAAVKVAYFARADAFSFLTQLLCIDLAGRWRLRPPLAVERCDRRIRERVPVVGVAGFCFQLMDVVGEPNVALYDLSDEGIALVFDPRRFCFRVEEYISGNLHFPGSAALDVTLQVRNIRDFPRQPHLSLVGTRFVGLTPEDGARLRGVMSEWGRGLG